MKLRMIKQACDCSSVQGVGGLKGACSSLPLIF